MPPESLSSDEYRELTQRFMASAQAHHHSAEHCSVNPCKEKVFVGDAYLHIVAFELFLLSIEQSLRLLCLLYTKERPRKSNHDIWALYKKLTRIDNNSKNIENQIVDAMNRARKTDETKPFTVKEIQTFLRKNKNAYSSTRYFWVTSKGEISPGFKVSVRAKQSIVYLSLILIVLGVMEMYRQGVEMIDPEKLGLFSEMNGIQKGVQQDL
ncbi:MAG: hypothetical protein OXO50_08205 [Caldilineaceae bacterium]|nr:hypothetical protein [Caldilineaceae bacterium]